MIQYSLVYLNAVSPQQENSQSYVLSVAVSVIYPQRSDLQSRTLLKTFWQAASCQSRDKAGLTMPMLISDFAFLSFWELSIKYLNKIIPMCCLDMYLFFFFFLLKSERFCFLKLPCVIFEKKKKDFEIMILLLAHHFRDVYPNTVCVLQDGVVM